MTKTSVDDYLLIGCGRCSLGGTPDCKALKWTKELKALRRIAQESGLTEEMKWGVPTYTLNGKNVLNVVALKDHACLSFFKGSLMQDTHGLLKAPGDNSQAWRSVVITDVKQIKQHEAELKEYIHQALELERQGKKVAFKKITDHDMPEELQQKLASDPKLKAAFEALTPGRQRGYLIHISGAKQSATRISRIEKCVPLILKGKGLQD